MKQALISPLENVYNYSGNCLGNRVAEIADQSFEIALPLFWVECANNVIADQFYYDGSTCQPIPTKPITPVE
jgi:hypothetical protein